MKASFLRRVLGLSVVVFASPAGSESSFSVSSPDFRLDRPISESHVWLSRALSR